MYTKEEAKVVDEAIHDFVSAGKPNSIIDFQKWVIDHTEPDLKSCPFCGSEAEIVDLGENRYHIDCTGCAAVLGEAWGNKESKPFLVELWNRRA